MSDPTAPGSDPVLSARIRDEIAAHGPMTFARFMELALYDPERGYYRLARPAPGREGDFLTAPETHPIFGAAVARQLDECWRLLERPDPFVLREYGAGSGTLIAAVVEGLRADGSGLSEAIAYEPVEVNDHRRVEAAERLAALGLADRLLDPRARPPDDPFTGVVLANEFLDALPFHRVEWRDGSLHEVLVDADPDGGFRDRLGPPSTPALVARLAEEGVVLREGQRAEIALGLDAWLAEVAGALRRGYVLVIDYGHPADELYGPRRIHGSLVAYAGHAAHDDPYANVGRQDLTAHVDLTAIARGAGAVGLDVLGTTSQAEFLVGVGVEQLLERVRTDPATDLAAYVALRSSLLRMLDPRAMGAFRVVVMGREVPPEPMLAGLRFRLRR